MKSIFYFLSFLIVFSCHSDDDKNGANKNNPPVINAKSFAIDEHSKSGTFIGTIVANDVENDSLTYAINIESGLEINKTSGEINLRKNIILDYEVNQNVSFTVSVSDGENTVNQDFILSINNINEYELLTTTQKETIAYFEYLTLWQASTHNPQQNTSRWMKPMKLYLDGEITAQHRANMISVIEEYNQILKNCSFNISIVDSLSKSNAHLYFGDADDIEELWPTMFNIIDGKHYKGYAVTANNNSILTNSKIWVSRHLPVLFKHEMGHTLGFGHSNKCNAKSFMCSKIKSNHDFLEMEKEIIRLAYANGTPAGMTAAEIQINLANTLFLEN